MANNSEKAKSPRLIIEDGQPTAVILDIKEYRELLERLEDPEDLHELDEQRKRALHFRPLDEFLREYAPEV